MYGSEGANSTVVAQDAPGGGGSAKSPSGGGGSAASGDGDSGASGNLKVGGLALVVVCAVVYGLRRLFRRS
jgi:hypothetical protein